ncbi:MAG: FtsX-like permease family protein, partial [Pseudomonadota bacterium]|nr:FtsX-like permease family protein [Pseudomonadota bacterium]
DSVSSIYLKATSAETLSAAYQEADATLRNLHGVTSDDDVDFSIATQESIVEAASEIDSTMTVMLGGIAAVSLLVGGIGVMNIMLVSVTERTREIGIRMATGARTRNIMQQFLIEALVVSLIGGVLGVFVGIGAAWLVEVFTERAIHYTLFPVLLAFCSAFSIGLIFGWLPARKAAYLDPVVALQSE